MEKYSIRAEIARTAPKETLDIIVKDVEIFADGFVPNKKLGYFVKETEEIRPNTLQRFAGDLKVNALGKQNYVPSCLIDINIDFFLKSCSSLLVHGYYDPFAACVYCYAKGPQCDSPLKRRLKADKKSLVAQITDIRRQRKRQIKYIRFGKISEAGSRLTREQLMTTLEACIEAKVSPIFPTKFLDYQQDTAELLRKCDAAVLYSIGNDCLESGAVANGCTNDFRFEQAVMYHNDKVKVALYTLIDARNYDNPLFRQNFGRAVRLHEQLGTPMQLLPIRPIGRRQLSFITGNLSGDMLVAGQRRLFGAKPTPGGYARTSNNQYYSTIIDSRFIELLKQPGIGMCHHNKETTWCGGCLHRKPASFPTQDSNPARMKRHKRKKRKDKNEILLFDN
jgi:hypothetical protein